MIGKISLIVAVLGITSAVLCGVVPYLIETVDRTFYQQTAIRILLGSGIISILLAAGDRKSGPGGRALMLGIIMTAIALLAMFILLPMAHSGAPIV